MWVSTATSMQMMVLVLQTREESNLLLKNHGIETFVLIFALYSKFLTFYIKTKQLYYDFVQFAVVLICILHTTWFFFLKKPQNQKKEKRHHSFQQKENNGGLFFFLLNLYVPYNTPAGEENHRKMLWRCIFQPLPCLWISLRKNHFLLSDAATEKLTHSARNIPTQTSTCHKRNIPWSDHLSWLDIANNFPV